MNVLAKKPKEIPEGYVALSHAPAYFNVPPTTVRRHTDSGAIEISLINDELVIRIDETIAVLTSPERTQLKTRLRVMEGLKKAGIVLEKMPIKNDLFA